MSQLVSIIIPVYNVAPYLDQCLQSIYEQTYHDWECIMVDDGSTDGSSMICDQWKIKDSRFIVIHQKNSGVSAARNNGINHARGYYVTFIDSDDWVDNNYLSYMLRAPSADLIVSGLVQFFPNGNKKIYKPDTSTHFNLSCDGIEQFTLLNSKYLLYGPVVKLFRKDIITKYNIHFPLDCDYGEDLQFCYNYLEHIKTISCIAECHYHYRILGNGTLSSKIRNNQFEIDYSQWKLLYDFHQRHQLLAESSERLLYRRLWGCIYDSIFLYPKLSHQTTDYFKKILSIPEISNLKYWESSFSCSQWIKFAILHRLSWLFKLYFFIK